MGGDYTKGMEEALINVIGALIKEASGSCPAFFVMCEHRKRPPPTNQEAQLSLLMS